MNTRVCVADDDLDVAAVLVEQLKINNYDAFAVHTGEDAIAACLGGGADLILLDVNLPDMSGYEVCERLKENPGTRHVGVIFVTVRGEPRDVALGHDLGAIDYIVKPYNLPMLMVRIDSLMRTLQFQESVRSTPDPIFDTAYTDELTGLRNRRYLLERLEEEVEKAHRYNHPVSCVLVEVDEVRALDAELGAAPLDDLLVEVALALRNYSRTYDVLARYEEAVFVAVLPHAPLQDAMGYANKILGQVSATTFSDPSFPTEAGVSIGIVTCRNGRLRGAEQVLGEAMRGLLEAKSRRENRIVARDLS